MIWVLASWRMTNLQSLKIWKLFFFFFFLPFNALISAWNVCCCATCTHLSRDDRLMSSFLDWFIVVPTAINAFVKSRSEIDSSGFKWPGTCHHWFQVDIIRIISLWLLRNDSFNAPSFIIMLIIHPRICSNVEGW